MKAVYQPRRVCVQEEANQASNAYVRARGLHLRSSLIRLPLHQRVEVCGPVTEPRRFELPRSTVGAERTDNSTRRKW